VAFPYFNPSADQYVMSGSAFFRIKQTLASAGDIFEVPQSGHCFAIGPDSDISQATIAYFDPQSRPSYSSQASPAQINMSTMSITPQRTFQSLISAVNKDGTYNPSHVPGRILIWPTEVYDASFVPADYEPGNDGFIFEPPVIDIVQFFSPTNAIPSRADKTYYYDVTPWGTDNDTCYVMIPYYGRRYASIQIVNTSSGPSAISVAVSGVQFRQADINPADYPVYQLFALGAPFLDQQGSAIATSRAFVLGTGYNNLVYPTFNGTDSAPTAGDMDLYNAGLFDYLLIKMINGFDVTADASLRVTVSDTVGRTGV
jgi:hypothetical protein